jgi:hypothetical protein
VKIPQFYKEFGGRASNKLTNPLGGIFARNLKDERLSNILVICQIFSWTLGIRETTKYDEKPHRKGGGQIETPCSGSASQF